MRKVVVGASRPLTAAPAGRPWQEQIFFSCNGMGRQANPLIHAAWAPPQTASEQAGQPRPMLGLECVSLLLQGSLRLADGAGHSASAQAGDVIWHGAGRGLLRQEAAQGQPFEMLELWINLPARHKHITPHCQHIPAADIPTFELPGGAGQLRLIAGSWQSQNGPAETAQPLHLWDLTLNPDCDLNLPLPHKWYAVALLLEGGLNISHWNHSLTAPQMALLDAFGDEIGLQTPADSGARLIIASGQPLNEAICAEGALSLDTPEALAQARQALADGQFGPPPTAV